MPSDKFYPTPLPILLQIILSQYERHQSILGIPEDLFFKPKTSDPFRTRHYGHLLETPVGVAAGPHTQLSQNIVAAWLTGARFIELKTIQTLDELEVSKPCIDMQDEGYNCEWSQELKIHQSFEQYLDAWILIHILKDRLNIGMPDEPGFIFNMSVGYDLKGILRENVQWFLAKMQNATTELQQKTIAVKHLYPNIKRLIISPCLSDNVTLSTMHGCPPGEIEQIGNYLLREKRLHTNIKLNPTLLGQEDLNMILQSSGFETRVPDIAFEHDLQYKDAVKIISGLSETAVNCHLQFGIKLTNTLESMNHKEVFSSNETMMYMSGRALHPVSVAIANKLQQEFRGRLRISFCGGADAFNIADLVACGLSPVTVCSDLLKPGGYGRLHQYIQALQNTCGEAKVFANEEFNADGPGDLTLKAERAAMENLRYYATRVLEDKRYRKTGFHDPSIKTSRPLGWFDCIHAPCEDTCPAHQAIPDYNYHTASGDFSKAASVILQTNPFPQTTGMICDHLCQTKCTRINYDHPVLIREIKRFVAEKYAHKAAASPAKKDNSAGPNAAIIGAGPSGLSCAGFLARAGFRVNVYESKPEPGGMLSTGIPSFRLTSEAIHNDVLRIEALGVNVHYSQSIHKNRFEELCRENDFIFIAPGAQRSASIHIEGQDAQGVIDPLKFLASLKTENPVIPGSNVLIIGGGNTAMDVARTTYRLVGDQGKVRIVYRRTIREMPADMGEIRAVLDEGMEIMQLIAPVRINTCNGKVISLMCRRMKLGPADADGRPKPLEIPGSEFEIEADTIIPAVGQQPDIDFCDPVLLRTKSGSYETRIPNVFIGGDALRGASTAINAIGDGRKAAQEIIDRAGIDFRTKPENIRPPAGLNHLMARRSERMSPVQTRETPLNKRKNFNLVSYTLTEKEALYEASRCLLCDEVCNTCVTVCPNLAFHCYEIKPVKYHLTNLVKNKDGWESRFDKYFSITQKYQILHIADWCNNCGNCNTFCPTAEAPYKNKPHILLSEEAFHQEDEGIWPERKEGKWILYRKSNGTISSLCEENGQWIYTFESNRIVLHRETMEVIHYEINKFEGDQIGTGIIAEMSVVMQGAISFMKHRLHR